MKKGRRRFSTYSAGKKVLLGMGLGIFAILLIASLAGKSLMEADKK